MTDTKTYDADTLLTMRIADLTAIAQDRGLHLKGYRVVTYTRRAQFATAIVMDQEFPTAGDE